MLSWVKEKEIQHTINSTQLTDYFMYFITHNWNQNLSMEICLVCNFYTFCETQRTTTTTNFDNCCFKSQWQNVVGAWPWKVELRASLEHWLQSMVSLFILSLEPSPTSWQKTQLCSHVISEAIEIHSLVISHPKSLRYLKKKNQG